MKKPLILLIALLICWPLPGTPKYAGLATRDFGILHISDLDGAGALDPWAETPYNHTEFVWQCLKPQDYQLKCEKHAPLNPGETDIGSVTFWVRAGGETYNFGSRRNWDSAFCEETIKDIQWVMGNEPIVCVAASFLARSAAESEWVIERVKTRKGAWAWFDHPGYNVGLPSAQN